MAEGAPIRRRTRCTATEGSDLVGRAGAGQSDRQGALVREARRFALSRFRRRSAGSPMSGWSMSRRSTARSSPGFRSTTCASGCSSAARSKGRSRREAARRMTRRRQATRWPPISSGRPRRPKTTTGRGSTRSTSAFHHMLTDRLGMAAAPKILDALRVHLERARRLTDVPARAACRDVARRASRDRGGDRGGDPDAAREAMRLPSQHHRRALRDLRKATARTVFARDPGLDARTTRHDTAPAPCASTPPTT